MIRRKEEEVEAKKGLVGMEEEEEGEGEEKRLRKRWEAGEEVEGMEEEEEQEEEEEGGEEDQEYSFTLSMENPIYSFFFHLPGALPEATKNSPGAKKTRAARDNSDSARENKLFFLAKQFCQQLDSEVISEELGQQIIKNLAFVCRTFINYPEFNQVPEKDSERGRKKRKVVKPGGEVGVAEREREEAEEDVLLGAEENRGNGLHWILRRLSFMGKFAFGKNELRVRSLKKNSKLNFLNIFYYFFCFAMWIQIN
jgi:hypothetical protein